MDASLKRSQRPVPRKEVSLVSMTWYSQDDVSVLALSGRLDAYVAPRVGAWLDAAAQAQPANVVVDLQNVTFIDSTGLAILVKGMRRCRQQAGDLFLCGLQQPVRTTFEVTRLDQAFTIRPSEAEAVASARGSSHVVG
jgi:anti-sigma B factor antagonist